MFLLLYWGVILTTLALGSLVVVGIAWSPFAAVILFMRMSRRGYKGARYAFLGGLYSVAFFVPWVLAMLEDWNPEETGVFTRVTYALLYTLWTVPMVFVLIFASFDADGLSLYANYMKVWLSLTALAWIASLLWLTTARPHAAAADGLPRLHQVLPFALFTISVVSLLTPLYV